MKNREVVMSSKHKKEDFAKQVRDNVSKFGFHTIYVGAGDSNAFCYSIGIGKTHRIPEIIISSLGPNLSHELISLYIDRFRASQPPYNQRIAAEKERFDYYLVPVPLERIKDKVLATIKFYGSKQFGFCQLVYPDTNSLFPGEKRYDYDQELFAEFSPVKKA